MLSRARVCVIACPSATDPPLVIDMPHDVRALLLPSHWGWIVIYLEAGMAFFDQGASFLRRFISSANIKIVSSMSFIS